MTDKNHSIFLKNLTYTILKNVNVVKWDLVLVHLLGNSVENKKKLKTCYLLAGNVEVVIMFFILANH